MDSASRRARTAPPRAAASPQRSERVRFAVLVLFLVAVFLMGGGSRADIISLVLLRPLAVILAAYALTVAEPGQIRSIGAPLYLLAGLAVLILIQLVPLPPSLWAALPGRDLYADAAAASGTGELWRPLSLSPAATFNSLLSLVVPFAALLLYALQSETNRRRTLAVLVGLALFSALWGLLQLTGASDGPLYLYRVTNEGLPVGLFANRNHQAVLLAGMIPMIAHLALADERRGGTGGRRAIALAAVLLLIATILVSGSRAGLLAAFIALVAAAITVRVHTRGAKGASAVRERRVTLMATGGAIGAIVVAGLFVLWSGKGLAIQRLFETNRVEEMRGQLLPILAEMTGSFFPVGAGFGAFDTVYDRFEPTTLLSDQYLNQAHNDWAQIAIEGGAAGILLLLLFLGWLAGRALRMWRDLRSHQDAEATRRMAALGFVLIIGVASLFDYPLRVPSLMAVFAIVCASLGRRRERESGPE